MSKLILTLPLLLILITRAFAPSRVIPIYIPRDIIPYQWFISISKLESSSKPNAVNKTKTAFGPVQITKLALEEVNKTNKTQYSLQDCFDIKVSWFVFQNYIKSHQRDYTIEEVVKIWRYGPYSHKNFLNRGYYIKMLKNLNELYMAKNYKVDSKNLKELSDGDTFTVNKDLIIHKEGKFFILKTKSGRGIFQTSHAKSIVRFLNPSSDGN